MKIVQSSFKPCVLDFLNVQSMLAAPSRVDSQAHRREFTSSQVMPGFHGYFTCGCIKNVKQTPPEEGIPWIRTPRNSAGFGRTRQVFHFSLDPMNKRHTLSMNRR